MLLKNDNIRANASIITVSSKYEDDVDRPYATAPGSVLLTLSKNKPLGSEDEKGSSQVTFVKNKTFTLVQCETKC